MNRQQRRAASRSERRAMGRLQAKHWDGLRIRAARTLSGMLRQLGRQPSPSKRATRAESQSTMALYRRLVMRDDFNPF